VTATPARRPLRFTPFLVLAHDLALSALALVGVLLVRYHFEHKPPPDHLVSRSAEVFVAICALVFIAFRQHRTMWRFTTLNEVLRLAEAVVVADLLLLPVLFVLDRAQDFPRSAPLLLAPVLIALLAFGRVLAHALAHGDLGAAFKFEDRSLAPAIVVGSTKALSNYLTRLRRERAAVRVAGLVTLDGAPFGRTIQGQEILGDLRRLTSIVKAQGAAEDREPLLVLAEPRPDRALMEAVVAAAGEAHARLVRVRESGGGGVIAPVDAADLLDRPPRRLDIARARRLIEGKRVLVTGAGGTIGGELTRQALKLGPERVVLLDASEFNLYAIDQALREEGLDARWTAELGDVRDVARLEALFARERPQVVLHAAALKHVPLMELNPAEAVLTNLGGAINVARLSRDAEALVFISTDKAVNPTNVMGATKRAAERAVAALTRDAPVAAAVVRFGNVLGSTGSVAPLFERQIARGGPLTVTHRDMTRYFMTVQEASSLVLQAATLPGEDPADPGGVYVLDMGEPVKIDHLARQMIQMHGLRPDTDIAVKYVGLRPGEKLYEEIFYDAEQVRPTGVDGVLHAKDDAPDWAELEAPVAALLAAAVARDEAAVIARLQALEPAFRRSP
jgi:FlaA1/EpsC-like NDP-sugar epimerase